MHFHFQDGQVIHTVAPKLQHYDTLQMYYYYVLLSSSSVTCISQRTVMLCSWEGNSEPYGK